MRRLVQGVHFARIPKDCENSEAAIKKAKFIKFG